MGREDKEPCVCGGYPSPQKWCPICGTGDDPGCHCPECGNPTGPDGWCPDCGDGLLPDPDAWDDEGSEPVGAEEVKP